MKEETRKKVLSYSVVARCARTKTLIFTKCLCVYSLRAAIAHSLGWKTAKSTSDRTPATSRFPANTPRSSTARNGSPTRLIGPSTNRHTKTPNRTGARSSGARSGTPIPAPSENTLKATLRRSNCNTAEPKIKSIRRKSNAQQQLLRPLRHRRRPDGTDNNNNSSSNNSK